MTCSPIITFLEISSEPVVECSRVFVIQLNVNDRKAIIRFDAAGEYARVERANAKENVVTVAKQSGDQVSYDPRRLQGVTLYRETERAFSQGDRVQFTAPNREQHIANRELGTIEKIVGRFY